MFDHLSLSTLYICNLFGIVNEIIKDKSTMIFVYCFSGARSEKACRKMKEMGYKNIKNIGGISQYQGKVI